MAFYETKGSDKGKNDLRISLGKEISGWKLTSFAKSYVERIMNILILCTKYVIIVVDIAKYAFVDIFS